MTDAPMSPHDKLCAAIGIIQDRILAEDSTLNAGVMFGNFRFTTSSLEAAERMLVDILEVVAEADPPIPAEQDK